MITAMLKKLKGVLWLLPGFLLWASFPPMGERMDVFFALAPLLWLSRGGDARLSAKRYLANGAVFWTATLSWMPAIIKNGGPWPLVVLGWGALSAYCALYFAAFGYLSAVYWRWVRSDRPESDMSGPKPYVFRLAGLLVVEPVLWAGLELVRSRLLGGFSWNQLGVAPVNAGLASPAALGGVYFASMVVVLVNGTLASIAERVAAQLPRRRIERPREWRAYPRLLRPLETLLPFAAAWLICVAGKSAAPDMAASSGEAPLRVALVQRNFPSVFERSAGAGTDATQTYRRLFSAVAHARPDLAVLPESALCEAGEIGSPGAGAFASWALEAAGAKSLLAGGSRVEDGRMYNSAALYSKGADLSSARIYDKNHLVPFGEYIPGDKTFPALQALAPVGSCTPGSISVLDLPGGAKLGVAICFEDTDSAHVRRLVEKGATLLAFITNDNWFSRSAEAEQHSWQAVARAVETGVSVVRCGNSGVTGVIPPDGSANWLRDEDGRPLVDAPAAMCEAVYAAKPSRNTAYVRFGDKPLAAAFALVLAAICFLVTKDVKRLLARLRFLKEKDGCQGISE